MPLCIPFHRSRFPPESKVSRDKRLGGKMIVGHNDNPGVSIRFGPMEGVAGKGRYVSGEAMLVKDGDGPPRLHSFSLTVDLSKGGSVCDWVSKTFGSDKAAKDCSGTYSRHVREKTKQTYCVGTPDGKCGVIVRCARRTGPKGPRERLSYRQSCRR